MVKRIIAALVLVLAVAACDSGPTNSLRLDQEIGAAHFSLIGQTTDSVSVSVSWSAVTDPSGIARYEWRDSTLGGPVITGTTTLLSDTLTVIKPPLNGRLDHEFQVRAVDGKGNVGQYSKPTRWGITHPDRLGPSAPDTVYLDTLIVVTDAVRIGVWPDSLSILEGKQAQLYTAILFENGTVWCDTSQATTDPAILYNVVAWPGACDSATVVARSAPWTRGYGMAGVKRT